MTPHGLLRLLLLLAVVLGVGACETTSTDLYDRQRAAMAAAIREEPAGDYFVGRRLFKEDYKMWGWVRKPGQPWKAAQLVMMNEQQKLAPDRASGRLGTDNDYEYRLFGYFSGETVYEPASNKFYPEFVLTGYELRSTDPPLIYDSVDQTNPGVRILKPPI